LILEISQKFSSSFSVYIDEAVLATAVHEVLSSGAVKLSSLCYGAQMLTRFETTRTSVNKKTANIVLEIVISLRRSNSATFER